RRSPERSHPWPRHAPRDLLPRASPPTAPLSRSRFSSQRTNALIDEIGGQFNALAFSPQSFEVVEPARLVFEDVHDEITIIKQDPFRRAVTFNPRCRSSALLKRVHYFVRHCLDLSLV